MSEAPSPVDFLTVPLKDGATWTRLDRLTDGRVMCAVCFTYCMHAELSWDPGDGQLTDVCKPCAANEAAMRERKA